MLRIVTDGAADMPSNWTDAYEINIIPINIHFHEETYLQGVDLNNEDFYKIVEMNGTIPKTSQPTPQQFKDFYRRIAEIGDTILSMHVTSKLSGTFESAQIASKELMEDFNIIPFDSASGSAALGFMCKEARLMERAGASIDQILERMLFIRENLNIIFALDTLEYAKMSGRVKTLQAALASLLNVKAIVVLQDGMLDMAGKVRTRQRSIERIIDRMRSKIGDKKVNVAVVQARDLETGKSLMERVRKIFNCNELIITDLSISVAANLGPGTVAIVAYPVGEGVIDE
jgi:DegV family protein with EDD domain